VDELEQAIASVGAGDAPGLKKSLEQDLASVKCGDASTLNTLLSGMDELE
jgi:hypothetical protein